MVRDEDEDDDERPRPKAKKPAPKPADDEDDEDDEDDDYERPRPKKKKKGQRRDEGNYKKSPVRFIILGVLVLVMVVLGIFLVLKVMGERAAARRQPAGTSLARTPAQTSATTLVAVA